MGERRAGSSTVELRGREALVRQLAHFTGRALRGERQVLVVVGGAGTGKTELVRDALALAPAMEVRRASGDPDETGLAFGVVDQLGLLDPACGPAVGPEPAAVGEALVAVLGATGAPPRVLVLEDAHWMDRPSLLALAYALRRLESRPLVALCTTRDPVALPAGLRRLAEDGRGWTVQTLPLSVEEARAAVRRWGAGPVSDPVLERLVLHTGGNPRHLRLLLEEHRVADLLDPRELPLNAPCTARRPHSRCSAASRTSPTRDPRSSRPCRRACCTPAARPGRPPRCGSTTPCAPRSTTG
jgi:hypothetical protein